MSNYIVGEETKRNILSESKKMFYSKGYAGTTYTDISSALNINRALIPYHYTNKQCLGQSVYAEMMNDFFKTFDTILDTTEFSSDFVSILHIVSYYQLLKDSHWVHFLYELKSDNQFSSFLRESEQKLISGLLEKNNKLTASEKEILLTCEIGMKKELIDLVHSHMERNTTLDLDNIAKMQLLMLLSYAGYSKKKIDELYDSAKEVVDMLSFHITNEFTIKISFN